MSRSSTMRSPKTIPPDYLSIRIDGFEPTWAGPNPFEEGFSLGSEDGMVAFTDINCQVTNKPQIVVASQEAINGIAGIDPWLAVSTRQEVIVLPLLQPAIEKAAAKTFLQGAHGVLASSNDRFVAPLGHAGVMTVQLSKGFEESLRVCSFGDGRVNIYQMCEMQSNGGSDLFLAACRSGGVGLIMYSSEKQEVEFDWCIFKDIDVVDVVAVGTMAYPHAAVAVGISGEVILFRDIVNHEAPVFLKYHQFEGKAYRILSSGGHLFVLTSKAVYVLGNLADRITQPALGDRIAPVMTLRMEAIDANICGDRWLLTVMQDEVRRYDVHQISSMIAEFTANSPDTASPLPQILTGPAHWQKAMPLACPLPTLAG